jgi:hypothetical protein
MCSLCRYVISVYFGSLLERVRNIWRLDFFGRKSRDLKLHYRLSVIATWYFFWPRFYDCSFPLPSMQFLARPQRTAVPAEYKYLECLPFENSLSRSLHSLTTRYSYPNKHTYSQLNFHSLQTSKCLPTIARTPLLPEAPPVPAARSCAEPLVPDTPYSVVQPELDAASCEERPVLAAQPNVAPPVPDATSCKWQHPTLEPPYYGHSRSQIQLSYPIESFWIPHVSLGAATTLPCHE